MLYYVRMQHLQNLSCLKTRISVLTLDSGYAADYKYLSSPKYLLFTQGL